MSVILASLFIAGTTLAQVPASDPVPRSDTGPAVRKSTPVKEKPKAETERSGEESSSKDNPVDLTPPADDINHPGTDEEDAITELKRWDPHRAAKDLEVGQYYLKEKNYRGAILRFRDALEFKPRDAEATYFLALTLEKTEARAEAAQRYLEYLEILPKGERAEECRKGLERTKGVSTISKKEAKKD